MDKALAAMYFAFVKADKNLFDYILSHWSVQQYEDKNLSQMLLKK